MCSSDLGIGIKFSGIATGSLVGILLNAILPGKDYKFDDDVNLEAVKQVS